MCLISKQKEPLITTKDIVCFKLVLNTSGSKFWRGIFFCNDEFPYGLTTALGEREVTYNRWSRCYNIGKGFFHAKINLKDAKIMMEHNPYYKLVKCIIPKGTEYYISINRDEVCSPSMIVYKDLDSCDKSIRYKSQAIINLFMTNLSKFKNLITKIFA